MSRWAEFLGDDYMTTHGRFVPYKTWAEAFYLALEEREAIFRGQDRIFGLNTAAYRDLGFSSGDVTLQDYILTSGNFYYANKVHPKQLFRSGPDSNDPFNRLTIESITDLLGAPLLTPPQKFSPATSEYLWQCKRILDCYCFWGGYAVVQKSAWFGTGGSDLSYEDAIARAVRRGGYRSNNNAGDMDIYQGDIVGVVAEKWYDEEDRKYLWYLNAGYDLTFSVPGHSPHAAAWDTWIFVYPTRPDGCTYWNPYQLEENTWNKVAVVHGDLELGYNQAVNLFPDLHFPENEGMGWTVDVNSGIVYVEDLRPGLEFYDPI